jgi:hypothetical protein
MCGQLISPRLSSGSLYKTRGGSVASVAVSLFLLVFVPGPGFLVDGLYWIMLAFVDCFIC